MLKHAATLKPSTLNKIDLPKEPKDLKTTKKRKLNETSIPQDYAESAQLVPKKRRKVISATNEN
jgi:hypothetical protein